MIHGAEPDCDSVSSLLATREVQELRVVFRNF